MNSKRKLIYSCASALSWSLLGGYRRWNYEQTIDLKRKQEIEKDIQEWNQNKSQYKSSFYQNRKSSLEQELQTLNQPKLYINQSLDFLLGMFFYLNPFLGGMCLLNELYRLEVNLRGLEEEKKSDRYTNFL